MSLRQRIHAASRASLIHFGISVVVGILAALLVFLVWYPHPYDNLSGGRELFFIVMSVDIVCGPLLTLIVFSPAKSRLELSRDIGLIALVQLAALTYGLHSVVAARPVFLSFESDRFRVATLPDIDMANIDQAPRALRHLGLTGPKPIGAALSKPTDPDFPQSIQLSMSGLHPSFRPKRWRPYEEVRGEVAKAAHPLTKLRARYPEEARSIDDLAAASSKGIARLGYLPLLAGRHTDWVVVVSLENGEPQGYLHLDGW